MPNEFVATNYNDVHRSLLQFLMIRGFLTSKEAKTNFVNIVEKCGFSLPDNNANRQALLSGCLTAIDQMIAPWSLRIKYTFCEFSGKQMIVLKNNLQATADDPFGGLYSPSEVELLKIIIELIMDADDAQTNIVRCLNSTDCMMGKKMSKKEAESFIQKMVAKNWFIDKNGYLSMHSRLIVDLDSYLRENFEVNECPMCRGIVMAKKDQTCDNCDGRVHKCCLARLTKERRQAPKCPNDECGQPWTHPLPEIQKSYQPEVKRPRRIAQDDSD